MNSHTTVSVTHTLLSVLKHHHHRHHHHNDVDDDITERLPRPSEPRRTPRRQTLCRRKPSATGVRTIALGETAESRTPSVGRRPEPPPVAAERVALRATI